jgi:2'-5' RNA ligase
VRLFVSVDLPPSLSEAVTAVQDEFGDMDGLRLTDPAQAHFTLTFLGEADPERVDEIHAAIEAAVGEADVDPFDCTIGGLGVFRSMEYITVIWAGVREDRGAAELTRLHGALETELTALGFEAADYEFTPHITLARMNDARSKPQIQQVVRETDPTIGTFRVDTVRLTETRLTELGPRYETVAEVDL